MKIFYWCPFIGNVATIDAVLNSIKSINKYSNNLMEPCLINSVGEWNLKKKKINKIKIIDFYKFNLIEYLPKLGFIKSRITYFLIFFLTVFKLHKILKKQKPEYLIIHLITFIPMFLMVLFNYETKFILRISGYPKLNIFRRTFWKIAGRKISYITTPTISTLNLLKSNKIFPEEKIIYIPDPVLNIEQIQRKKNDIDVLESQLSKQNSLITIGRLTKQKNFGFLIDVFHELQNKHKNLNLFIIGEGEEKQKLINKINELKLTQKIFLIGYKNNVFNYLKNSKMFISTSLWEDPGFVLLEAGYCNKTVLSSNCPNGPVEILENGKNGFLFKSNSQKDFIEKFEEVMNCSDLIINKKKILLKKKCKEFTLLNHFKRLKKIFN